MFVFEQALPADGRYFEKACRGPCAPPKARVWLSSGFRGARTSGNGAPNESDPALEDELPLERGRRVQQHVIEEEQIALLTMREPDLDEGGGELEGEGEGAGVTTNAGSQRQLGDPDASQQPRCALSDSRGTCMVSRTLMSEPSLTRRRS